MKPMINRTIWLFSLLVCIPYACEKGNTRPDLEIPESVAQLMDNEACGCDPRISLFKWGDQLLYMHHSVGPYCLSIPRYYDLEGNEVELDLDEQNQFWSERELVKIIWECGK